MTRYYAIAFLVGCALAARADAAVTGTTTQLSQGNASETQTDPAVSNTEVVWTDVTNPSGTSSFDIWFLDLATGLPARDLTNTPSDNEFLEDVDGTNVVWTHTSASVTGDVVVYDLTTNTATTIATSAGGTHYEQPSVRGRYVVFLRVGAQTDVAAYDLTTQFPTPPVTNDAALQARPRVSGDLVVYEDYGSGNADIFGYHLATQGPAFPIATRASGEHQPDVDGNFIVWVDDNGNTSPSGTDQIMLYDAANGTTRQLTTIGSHKLQPRISGSRVVWSDDRSGNLDVYTYDLTTNTEDLLVGGTGDQMLAAISGSRIVYTDNASGFESVYLFTIADPPPPPPPPPNGTLPEGCDPNKTDLVGSAVTMTRSGHAPAFAAAAFSTVAGKTYYVCVDNGKSDGSEKTAHFIFTTDGDVDLTPADFKPSSNPPAHVAKQLDLGGDCDDDGDHDGDHHGHQSGTCAGLHFWAAGMFGAETPAQATVSIRVHK